LNASEYVDKRRYGGTGYDDSDSDDNRMAKKDP
jgi:hypothetical protein